MSTKRPCDEGAVSLIANEVLMLHNRLKIIQEHVEEGNKTTLESEKVRDELQNQIEQIEQWMYPRRTHTHEFCQEATRAQNCRNVKVGSLENQPKCHTDKDGFLCHIRLGLVGWISYWLKKT